jgi:hypothetical protein
METTMTKTRDLIVSGTFVAPPPPSQIQEYAQWAALFGIPFKARTPHQLKESLNRVKAAALVGEGDEQA